jgi:hypothetical protein
VFADTMRMERFEHDRLDMYRAAIDFLALADTIASDLPRGRAYLADQLRRAATSILLTSRRERESSCLPTRHASTG